jgi:hypothetical protein
MFRFAACRLRNVEDEFGPRLAKHRILGRIARTNGERADHFKWTHMASLLYGLGNREQQ